MAKGALWSTMEDDRTWIDNPRGRRRRKGSRARSRKRSRRARARRNIGTVAPFANPRRRRRSGGGMARRKGRRRFRRNPGGLSTGGMVRRLQQGVKDALFVTAGEVGAGLVGGFFPAIPRTGIVGLAVQGVTAIALGEVTTRFLKNRDGARFVVAGALAKPLKTLMVMLKLPVVSPALSGVGSYAPLGAIPTLTRGPVFEGPRLSDQIVDGDAVMQGY